MKYKQIPFNMTLAKRISDGSVNGRLYVAHNGSFVGEAKYIKSIEDSYVFGVSLPPTPFQTKRYKELSFTRDGDCIEIVDGHVLKLQIEITVDDSYNDECCNVNSGITEKQEQEKDGHYHKCKIEPIEYILANGLGFCEGNIVKYITRYKDKGKPLDDLRKIKVYVDYLIDNITDKNNGE